MRKKVKNALIVGIVGVFVAGLGLTSACSGYYKSDSLGDDYEYEEVISNGGFAVEAGNYVYFINGVESNDADNSYGDVQKGALVRISVDNLAAGNYEEVDTVVPLVMYSDTYDAGIYIYGDYIYYCTPSTSRDSDGEVQSDLLEFKSTKLDGTETMKSYYCQSTPDDYRIVEVDGTVYLIYAMSSETLYDESSGVTNIHSVNFDTGEDVVLAYNVEDYIFDTEDPTNPYVYYTMGVTYNLGTGNEVDANYNQLYRVCANATEESADEARGYSYDFSYVLKYDEDFDEEETPLYINLGELVFDGLSYYDQSMLTQFNYGYDPDSGSYRETIGETKSKTITGFEYTLSSYENGILYYVREGYDSNASITNPVTLYLTDYEYDSATSWNAVTQNPVADDDYDGKALQYGDNYDITEYTIIPDDYNEPDTFSIIYTTDDDDAIMYSEFTAYGNGSTSTVAEGLTAAVTEKYSYPMVKGLSAEITIYTFSEETVDGEKYTFMYYGVSGEGNNYSVHRVALYGDEDDYNKLATSSTPTNYHDQRICDLDVYTSWYMPEIIEGQLLFASETTDMADYEYIMAFDLTDADNANETMSNADIKKLTDRYNDVLDDIAEYEDDDEYENLSGMLEYAFYTGDTDYIYELIELWEDEGEEMETWLSAESLLVYKSLVDPTQTGSGKTKQFAEAFAEYKEYSREVNGETVYATSRNYYYSLIGYMSDDDYEDYIDGMREDYCYSEPEEGTWFEELDTWAKVLFIVGVSLAGLIVIAAAVLIPIFVVRKKRKGNPALMRRRRMRVDTTDDRSIDVYSDPDSAVPSPDGTDGADGE